LPFVANVEGNFDDTGILQTARATCSRGYLPLSPDEFPGEPKPQAARAADDESPLLRHTRPPCALMLPQVE
jgi:hypothetical protein